MGISGASGPAGSPGSPIFTVCTFPIAPAHTHSHKRRIDSLECPWFPSCVTTLLSCAVLFYFGTGLVITHLRRGRFPDAHRDAAELRARYLVNVESYGKVQGQPLMPSEMENQIWQRLG